MPLFIKLTVSGHGHSVFVNINNIAGMMIPPNMTHTEIELSGSEEGGLGVKETPEEILMMIDSVQTTAKFDTKPHRFWWAESES